LATDLARHTFERIQFCKDNSKGKYNKLVPGIRPLHSLSLPIITINMALWLDSAIPGYPVEHVVKANHESINDRKEVQAKKIASFALNRILAI